MRAINAIMKGPQWNSTAIVIVWDEWGGFHDHAVPPTAAGMNANISYGFRVPLLVISPWTKIGTLTNGGYVSSRFASHASLLRFVESAFGLPSLGAMDDLANYTATEPKPGDLMDFFDFLRRHPAEGEAGARHADVSDLVGGAEGLHRVLEPGLSPVDSPA